MAFVGCANGPIGGPGSGGDDMAKYLVLIYEQEGVERDPALEAEYAKHWTFIEANKEQIVAGEALQPTSTGTSLRHDGSGEYVVTDGPFIETKEALAGFYLLEAADLDAAIALARQVPAPLGGLEIRPVMVFEQGGM
jgi:hypothetical protein